MTSRVHLHFLTNLTSSHPLVFSLSLILSSLWLKAFLLHVTARFPSSFHLFSPSSTIENVGLRFKGSIVNLFSLICLLDHCPALIISRQSIPSSNIPNLYFVLSIVHIEFCFDVRSLSNLIMNSFRGRVHRRERGESVVDRQEKEELMDCDQGASLPFPSPPSDPPPTPRENPLDCANYSYRTHK